MVANATTVLGIGVQMMPSSREDRLVLLDVPGIGIVYNELPRAATKLGMDVAELARASYLSFKTVQRVWNNDATGLAFESLLKLAVALDMTFDELFPMERDPRYFNPFIEKKKGDL